MKRLLPLLICLLTFVFTRAQSENKPKYPHVKLTSEFDGKFTWVENKSARLFGVRMGVEIDRIARFGFGYYELTNPVYTNSLVILSPDINHALLNMNYLSVYYEQVLVYTKKYEWALNAQTGKGTIYGTYSYTNGTTADYSTPFGMRELNTTIYRHLTYFMSIGCGIGYRHTSSVPQELRPVYNAPIIILKVRFQPIKMMRGIWNKEIRERY